MVRARPDVYPNTTSRARYLIRAHKTELLAAGALCRVGRELVVIGAKYHRWLEERCSDVPGYESNANVNREAAAAA